MCLLCVLIIKYISQKITSWLHFFQLPFHIFRILHFMKIDTTFIECSTIDQIMDITIFFTYESTKNDILKITGLKLLEITWSDYTPMLPTATDNCQRGRACPRRIRQFRLASRPIRTPSERDGLNS